MKIKINYNVNILNKVVRRSWPKRYLNARNEGEAWNMALEFAQGVARRSIEGLIIGNVSDITNVYPMDEEMMPFHGFRNNVIQPINLVRLVA